MVGLTWKFRTLGMFVAMSGILMALGAFIGYLFQGKWMIGLGIMCVISLIFCFVSYFFSKEMALKANGARIVSEAEYPELYKIVREVAQAGNLPMPEVGICNQEMPNAFATGRNPNNAAVVVTTGIMRILPRDELKGVIAHEMSHVKNRDIAVMSIASALSSIISYVSNMVYWMAFSNAINNREGGNERIVILVVAIALQILVPFAALLVQLGISRNREFLADETGARMINDPLALARALEHISSGSISISEEGCEYTRHGRKQKGPADNYSYADMWIANPLKEDSLVNKLFSTHPPMSERIARLRNLAKELGKY